MADIKATSFRINEEDVEKFKAFMEQQGIKTQADGFKSIMQTVELAQAKGQIKDRAKEVELFQDTINRLMGYYLNSLEVNQNSEERIREELSKELNTKDNTISNLQEQLTQLKEDNRTLKELSKDLDNNNKNLNHQIQDLNNSIAEKNNAIEIANRNNNNLQDQIAEYRQYKEEYKNLEKQLEQLQLEIKKKDKAINDLTNSNIQLKDKVATGDYVEELYKGMNEGLKIEITELKANINLLEQKHKEELKEIKAEYKEQLKEIKEEHKQKLGELEKIVEEKYRATYASMIASRNEQIQELTNAKEKLAIELNTIKAKPSTKK